VSDSPFRDLLSAGAERARLRLDPVQTDLLELYFDLLQRWNRTINLTALPLEPATADTIDRLFIEPLVAAQFLATSSPVWFDLGSGNGSPAIPMKTALPGVDLTMVESRSRRAAFLSEVVRALQLDHSRVENLRFEELPSNEGSIDLITVRAVRLGSALETAARRLLRRGGWLAIFGPAPAFANKSFEPVRTVQLIPGQPTSALHISAFVPRGTNPLTSI